MRDPSLHPGWRDYRFRFRVVFLIWLSYVPGMWLVWQFIQELLPVATPFIPVIALAWMGALAVACYHLGTFPCPSCREYYFLNGLTHNPFGRRCRHCGLRKWANPDHEAKPANESRSQP